MNTMKSSEKDKIIRQLNFLFEKSPIPKKRLIDYFEIDYTTIHKIQNGQKELTLGLIDKLNNLFGCNKINLLYDEIPRNCLLKQLINIKNIEVDDLKRIAAINKITENIRQMNNCLSK